MALSPVAFENRRAGCYLGESAPLNQINEEIIVSSGEGVLLPGTVLAKVTASGEYVAHDAGGAGGAEIAAALLFDEVDATSAAAKGVATVRGPATINDNLVTYQAGISTSNKAAAQQALRDKGLAILPQSAG